MDIRGNKGLFAYYRKFKSIVIDEKTIRIHKSTIQRICLPLTLLLCVFYENHCTDTFGHTGLEKTKKKHHGEVLFSKPNNMDKNTNSRLHTMSNKQSICKHKNKK